MKPIGPMVPSHDQGLHTAPAEVQDDFGGIAVEAPPEVADDFGGIPAAPAIAEPPPGEPLPRRAIVPDRTPRVPEWVKADPSYQRRAEILGFLERNTKLNPQEAHEAARIAAAGGGDINYVAENLATLRPLYAEKTQEDWEALAANAPGTADFLTTDPATFAMARAESEKLSGIEYALTGRWEMETVRSPTGYDVTRPKWTPPVWAEILGDEIRRQELIFRQTAALATRPSEEVEVQQRLLSALAIAHEQGIDARAGDEVWTPIYARAGLQKTPEGEFRVVEGTFPPAPTEGAVENAARIEELRVATAPKDYGPFERTVAGKFVFAPFRLAPMMGGATLSAGAGGLAAGPAGAIGGGVSWWTFQNYAPLAEQLAMEVGPDGQKLTADQASEQALAWSLFSSVLMEAGVTPLLANLPGAGQVFQRAMARAPAAALANPSVAKRVVTALGRAGKHTVTGAAGAAAQAAANATAVEIARASLDPERSLDLSSFANISNATTEAFETALVDMLAFGLLGAGRTLLQDRGLRLAALDSRERLRAMTDRAAESELLRNVPPERTAELVQSIKAAAGLAPDAVVDTVYADRAGWDRYWQEQKIDPRAMAAEVMGDGGRAYDQAASSKAAALPIPVEAYLSKLAAAKNGEHARGLAPDLTLDPEVNTPRQEAAEAALRNRRTRELAKLPPDKMEADQRQVFEAFRDQALAAREAPDVAEANAATFSASLKVLAERAGRGETALDLWKEHPVNITSERGRRSEERALYTQALAEWDLHPAGRALAWLRGGEAKADAPTTGADTPSASPFDAIAAQLRERAVAMGKAAVPEAITLKIEKVRAKIASLEEKSTGKTHWRSDQALGRPSATKTAEVVMFPDPETGAPAWGLAGADGVGEGGKAHTLRLPSWLEADDFLAHRKAWEWTWAALGGPDAPEQAQKLVFGYMRPSLEDLPEVSKYGIQQGYSVARLTQGKGGRAYESTREALERWANEPEATRAEDPVDPRAWGGLLTATRTNKEAVARGKFINFKNVDAFGKWFETTSREIDEARPFYDSRPPEWYGKPGEAPEAPPAAGKEGERAAALRQELAKLEAEAREAALKGAKESRKLDFEETTRILGKDAAKLPTEPGGIKPSELAGALGVESADVLLRDMVEMADRSKWAKREAGLRMVKREPARAPEVLVQERLARVEARIDELIPSGERDLAARIARARGKPEERARIDYEDPKTGVLNDRALWDAPPDPAAPRFALVDFAGKKAANDEAGHETLDRLFRAVSRALVAAGADHVAKVGGSIMFRTADPAAARAVLDAAAAKLPKWMEFTLGVGERKGTLRETVQAIEDAERVNVEAAREARSFARRQEMPREFQGDVRVPDEVTDDAQARQLRAHGAEAYRKALGELSVDETPLPIPKGLQEVSSRKSDAELARAAYQTKGGLLSAAGDAATGPRRYYLSADLRKIKAINGEMGREQADVALHIIERMMAEEGAADVFGSHLSGDEFKAKHDDIEVLKAYATRLREAGRELAFEYRHPVTGEIRTFQGFEFAIGIGDTWDKADGPALRADKKALDEQLPSDWFERRISRGPRDLGEGAQGGRAADADAGPRDAAREGALGGRAGFADLAPERAAEVASLLAERDQLRGQLGLRLEQEARPSLKQHLARIRSQKAAELVAKRALLRRGARPVSFPDRSPNLGSYFVHPDTYPGREGQWRVTRFDAEHNPVGHSNAKDFAAALDEAVAVGADLSRPDSILFQEARQPAPIWYSALERAAEGAKQAKGTADSWLAVLSRSPGVKGEEVDATGMRAWLTEVKDAAAAKDGAALRALGVADVRGVVTREEVLARIQVGRIEVKERILGEGRQLDPTGLQIRESLIAELAEEGIDYEPQGPNGPRFMIDTVPAGGKERFEFSIGDARLLQSDRAEGKRERIYETITDSQVEAIRKAGAELVALDDSKGDGPLWYLVDGKPLPARGSLIPTAAWIVQDIGREAAKKKLTSEMLAPVKRELEAQAAGARLEVDAEAGLKIVPGSPPDGGFELRRADGTRHGGWYATEESAREAVTALQTSGFYERVEREYLDHIKNLEFFVGKRLEEYSPPETRTGTPQYEEYVVGGHSPRSYRELLIYRPEGSGFYRSPHFGQENSANLLAHARVSEHVDTEGLRVLLVEEVQSDLHQAGREHGYANAKVDPASLQLIEKMPNVWRFRDPVSGIVLGRARGPVDNEGAARKAVAAEIERMAREEQRRSGAVADTPFKEGWEDLVVKRLLRYAADRGYERVALTPGEVHSRRWGSELIAWEPVTDRDLDILATPRPELRADVTWENARNRIVDELKRFIKRNEEDASGYVSDLTRGEVDAARAELARLSETKSESDFKRDLGRMAGGFQVDSVGQGFLDVATRWGLDTIGILKADRPARAFAVNAKEQAGGEVAGMNLEEAAVARGLVKTGGATIVGSLDELESLIGKKMGNWKPDRVHSTAQKLWERMQTEPEGAHAPRVEGFAQAYDKRLRGALEKIAKKYGGRVIENGRLLSASQPKSSGMFKQKVHEVELPPEARQRILSEGMPLFQEGKVSARLTVEQPPKKGEAPRGYVDLAPWGAPAGTPHRIHLADSDRSTLAHESFHVLSRVFGEVAMREDAPSALRADYEGFLKAIGYSSHAERAASADAKREEKATHLWEAFLAEGKAPSQELLPAFARFRAWMKRIYQGVKGVADQYRQTYGEEIALSDDVRGIFQRLLAGDAAVADASKAVEAEAPRVHLTPEEQAESERLRTLARAEAEARLQRVLVEEDRKADRAFMKEARAKVTEQVEAEVAKEKAYAAIDALEKGDVAGAALKLDRDAVVAAFGEDVAARLPKGVFGKDGAPPEVVAEALAYGSAADLVLGLANAPKRSDRVRELVAGRMAELFPSLEERPAALVVAASDAVNGDALLREGLVRLRAMAREAGIRPRITDLEALKEAAQAAVSQRTITELHPERFEIAAKSFARQAAHLKTPEARLDAYEAYLFNRAVHRAARDAQEQADKSAAFLAKYQRPAGRAKVGKAQETGEDGRISQPYLNAIDELLATVEFGASKTLKEVHGREARLAELERWVQERWADGDSVIIPPATLSALRRTRHWKDLTVSELDGLVDAVKSIATQAELRTKFEVGGQKIEMSRVVEELRQAAIVNGAKVPQTLVPANRPAGEKAKELGRQALHMVERPEVLFDYLDGFDPEGPWKKYVWNVLSDASYRYYDLVRSTNETIQKLLRELPAEERRRIKETRFEVEGQPYTLENAIVVGLNAGNDSNLGKLAKGMSDPRIQENYGIQPWQGRASIDAFLAQLTAKDVEIINAIHKALESYWPESEALEKRDVGIAPPKVPTRPLRFRGKDGAELVIEGGYYPLIYSRLYRVGKTQAEADALAMNGLPGLFSPTYDRAMTPQSHLQERIEAFARPFDLTLDALPRKLTMTAKDIAFRLPAKQIYRALMDERISGALAQALGDRGHDLVMGHLKDAVNDVMLPDVGAHLALRLINGARSLTYRSTFALNVPQTLQNIADVAGVQAVVPRRYFMAAALDLARERDRWMERILADSPEMRIRMDGLSKSLVRDMESTFRRSEIALKWEHAQELMLLPFETTQKMTEFPTYLASYRHALTPKEKGGLGLDHAGAVRHAEGAVRTMYGGKRTIDLTPIQRDKVMRHFTMFWGWASAQLNQFIAASGKSRRAWNEGMRFRAFKIVGSAFAALWAKQLASEVLVGRGPKDEDEDGEILKDPGDWARWVAFRGVMTLPSFAPVVSAVARGVEADTQRDVSLTPWLNLLNAGVKASRKTAATVEDAFAGEADEDAEIDLFLAWLEAGGQLTGAPVSQVRRTAGYWADRPGDAAVGEDVLGTAFGPSRPGKLSETIYGR